MDDKIKIVRVEKKKGSLGFSIKGGIEHGIPIVVSEIDKNGPSNLHLGDELVYVNEASLMGATHSEAVQKLRNCKGPSVQLRVRTNRILEDTFSSPMRTSLTSEVNKMSEGGIHTKSGDWWSVPDDNPTPLPRGWTRHIDYKSGKPYFENYLTYTSTWTDPRTLKPEPIYEFNWRSLPSGWERFKDQHGDVYYVNHDTQTTHWDSPRGSRQQKQIEQLKEIVDKEKERLKKKENDLSEKRTVILDKNQQLEKLQEDLELEPITEENEEESEEELSSQYEREDMKSTLIDDIMALNDEIDELDASVQEQRKKIHKLSEILWKAQEEDMNDNDQYESAKEVAMELQRQLKTLKAMEADAHQSIRLLEEIRGPEDTPLSYMLQLTPAKKRRPSNSDEEEDCSGSSNDVTTDRIHLLSDELTGKTNCEMRLELLIFDSAVSHASHLIKRVSEVCQWVTETRRGFDWDNVTDQLLGVDLSVFNTDWLQSDDIREKVELFMDN